MRNRELNKHRKEDQTIDFDLLASMCDESGQPPKGKIRPGDSLTVCSWADVPSARIEVIKAMHLLDDAGVVIDFSVLTDNWPAFYYLHGVEIEKRKSAARRRGRNRTGNKGGKPQEFADWDIKAIYADVACGGCTLQELPQVYCAQSTLHRRCRKMGIVWPPEKRSVARWVAQSILNIFQRKVEQDA